MSSSEARWASRDHVRIEEGAILGAQSGIPTKKVIRGKRSGVLGNAGASRFESILKSWRFYREKQRRNELLHPGRICILRRAADPSLRSG